MRALDGLLLAAVGFSRSGIDTIGGNQTEPGAMMNATDPTTALLAKCSPTYTCLFQGAQWFLENGGRGVGRQREIGDHGCALLAGADPYSVPGQPACRQRQRGAGGKPSCGLLPDVSKNFPVKYRDRHWFR